MSIVEVDRLFEAIQSYYATHERIDSDLEAKLFEAMKNFEGAEEYVQRMSEAFQKLVKGDEEGADCFICSVDEESSASTNRWKFDVALSVFKVFKFKCTVEKIPVQKYPQAPQQPLPQQVQSPKQSDVTTPQTPPIAAIRRNK